jgi:hypothetical protein
MTRSRTVKAVSGFNNRCLIVQRIGNCIKESFQVRFLFAISTTLLIPLDINLIVSLYLKHCCVEAWRIPLQKILLEPNGLNKRQSTETRVSRERAFITKKCPHSTHIYDQQYLLFLNHVVWRRLIQFAKESGNVWRFVTSFGSTRRLARRQLHKS